MKVPNFQTVFLFLLFFEGSGSLEGDSGKESNKNKTRSCSDGEQERV
jgi:hypothetical protein